MIYTWDARPYPYFPLYDTVWSDGPNWIFGQWIGGKLSTYALPQELNSMAVATTSAPLSPYIVDPATGKLDKQYRDFFEGHRVRAGRCDPKPDARSNAHGSGERDQRSSCRAALAEPDFHMSAGKSLVRRATPDDVARFVELGLRFYAEEGGREACPRQLARFAFSHLDDENRVFLVAGRAGCRVFMRSSGPALLHG